MPMDFVDRLRMNNIFPSGNFNPLQAPQRQSLDIPGIVNMVDAMHERDRQNRIQEEGNIHARARYEQLQDIARNAALQKQSEGNQAANPMAGMRYSYGGEIPQTKVNGQSLNDAEASRVDPIFKSKEQNQLAQMGDMSGAQRAAAFVGLQKEKNDLEINKGKLAIDQGKLGVSQHRANIYEFKALHPGMKFQAVKGGNVMAIDPITGQAIDTGVETGTLSDREKEEIKDTNTMKRVNREIEGRGELEGTRHENRLSEIGARGTEQRKTKEDVSPKAELPTQTRVRQVNLARQFANEHPDLAKYIQLGEGNEFSIEGPRQTFFGSRGPTSEQYRQMLDFIYGNGNSGQPAVMVGGRPMSFEQFNNIPELQTGSRITPSQAPPAQAPAPTQQPQQPQSRYRVTVR